MHPQRLLRRPLVGMAGIPAGIGGQWHRQIWQADPHQFVAILIDCGDERGGGGSHLRRQLGGHSVRPLRPEVKPLRLEVL
jgi:hypothetical protein